MEKNVCNQADEILNGLIEELAALEHERWSHWQKYMHNKGQRQPNGDIILPAELVTRWEAQSSTEYKKLTDSEKESDRDQVRRYLPTIKKAFAGC